MCFIQCDVSQHCRQLSIKFNLFLALGTLTTQCILFWNMNISMVFYETFIWHFAIENKVFIHLENKKQMETSGVNNKWMGGSLMNQIFDWFWTVRSGYIFTKLKNFQVNLFFQNSNQNEVICPNSNETLLACFLNFFANVNIHFPGKQHIKCEVQRTV